MGLVRHSALDAKSSSFKYSDVWESKLLAPTSIGENAANVVNGQMKSKISATLISRSFRAQGNDKQTFFK